MSIHLLTEKISRVELKTIAQESFEVMVKAVVDVAFWLWVENFMPTPTWLCWRAVRKRSSRILSFVVARSGKKDSCVRCWRNCAGFSRGTLIKFAALQNSD